MPAGRVSLTTTEAAVDGPRSSTSSENCVAAPAATGLAPEVVLVIARSARSTTGTVSRSALLLGSGSLSGPSTLASFTRNDGPYDASTSTTTERVGAAARLLSVAARSQVTTSAAALHTQPVPVALTKLVPAGSASVTGIVPGESDGPVLVTSSDQVYWAPAVAEPVCDLTIASAEHARFKQTDADVGSFDAGYGSAYFARQVGQKFAREVFFLAREYSAKRALEAGAVNAVVPHAELEATAYEWAREILTKSPTSIRMLKFAFNAVDDGLVGQQLFAGEATRLAYGTDEAAEGRDSFLEKREPDWSPYPWQY